MEIEVTRKTILIVCNVTISFVVIIFCTNYFFLKILDTDGSTKSAPTPCNCTCTVTLDPNISLSETFTSFTMDSSSAMFVHWQLRNVSLKHSGDILDPVNFVWVVSNEAPFLSLDLGFNMYSWRMLSSKIHHMTVIIEGDNNRMCLWGMSYTCTTQILATTFLKQVTNGKGALCYLRDDLKYQCCEINHQSEQIDCSIPTVATDEMAGIFIVIAILMFIAVLFCPILLIYIPNTDNPEFESLSNNTQIYINPVYRCLRQIFLDIGNVSLAWANLLRHLVIGTLMASLFFISVFLDWYIKENEIHPKMFNEAVRDTWYSTRLSSKPPRVILVVVIPLYTSIILLYVSNTKLDQGGSRLAWLLGHDEETSDIRSRLRDFKIDLKFPYDVTKMVGLAIWNKAKEILEIQQITWTFKTIIQLSSIGLFIVVTTPFIYVLVLILYLFYNTPLSQTIIYFHVRALSLHCTTTRFVQFNQFRSLARKYRPLLLNYLTFYLLSMSMPFIVGQSLLLLSRLIVYGLTGLVVNTDNILPKLALASVLVFDVGSDIVSAMIAYENLLNKTFEECKKQLHRLKNNQPLQLLKVSIEKCEKQLGLVAKTLNKGRNRQVFIDVALEECSRQQELLAQITEGQQEQANEKDFLYYYGNKNVPFLSTKLFQNVIDEILPISVTYTNIFKKAIRMLLYGLLIYYSILIFGQSKLDEVTQAFAVLCGSILPKLVPMLFSSLTKSHQTETSCKIEKIVRDFIDARNRTINHTGYNNTTNEESLSIIHNDSPV